MRPHPTHPVHAGRRRSRRLLAASAVATVAALIAAFAGASSPAVAKSKSPTTPTAPVANKKPITLLFGSSGPAETAAENAAARAFTKKTGIPVKVEPAANLSQQLAEDFAANTPPNLFYLDPTSFQEYVTKGVLADYGKYLPNASDFFPSLTSAFTYKGQMYCAPKDASALSLYINNADWAEAGLTKADFPTTWSQLASDAKKLTTSGRVGFTTDPNESRLDAFLYQSGGSVLNKTGTKVVLDSAANIRALSFVQSMLKNGSMAFPSTLNENDEIPALGDNKAAMIISGPWMQGEMKAQYPSVAYNILPLPAGPTGVKGTLTFTNCWGVAKRNDNLGGTIEFVKFLTTEAQQLRFTAAFGPIPSLESAAHKYETLLPGDRLQASALFSGHPDISIAGSSEALNAFNSSLANLASQSPESILSAAQTNLQAVVNQNNHH